VEVTSNWTPPLELHETAGGCCLSVGEISGHGCSLQDAAVDLIGRLLRLARAFRMSGLGFTLEGALPERAWLEFVWELSEMAARGDDIRGRVLNPPAAPSGIRTLIKPLKMAKLRAQCDDMLKCSRWDRFHFEAGTLRERPGSGLPARSSTSTPPTSIACGTRAEGQRRRSTSIRPRSGAWSTTNATRTAISAEHPSRTPTRADR
jgi:hypothetical protein